MEDRLFSFIGPHPAFGWTPGYADNVDLRGMKGAAGSLLKIKEIACVNWNFRIAYGGLAEIEVL